MKTLLEGNEMRFILNGRTFDTATSKALAVYRAVEIDTNNSGRIGVFDGAQEVRLEMVLYRTAKGALFIHDHSTVKYRSGRPVVDDSATEVNAQEAVKWIESNRAAIISPADLPLPPEA